MQHTYLERLKTLDAFHASDERPRTTTGILIADLLLRVGRLFDCSIRRKHPLGRQATKHSRSRYHRVIVTEVHLFCRNRFKSRNRLKILVLQSFAGLLYGIAAAPRWAPAQSRPLVPSGLVPRMAPRRRAPISREAPDTRAANDPSRVTRRKRFRLTLGNILVRNRQLRHPRLNAPFASRRSGEAC